MLSMNEHTIIGNVGRDPEIRSLQSGNSVANLAVATNRRYKDKSGEWQEDTQWHNVVIYGPLVSSVIEKYVSKGSQVMVRGESRTRKWQDKDGNDRYTTEIVVSGPSSLFRMMGSKGNGSSNGGEDTGDEIPF